jgi:hypothetical protein
LTEADVAILVELDPETEARQTAEAEARGLEVGVYVGSAV